MRVRILCEHCDNFATVLHYRKNEYQCSAHAMELNPNDCVLSLRAQDKIEKVNRDIAFSYLKTMKAQKDVAIDKIQAKFKSGEYISPDQISEATILTRIYIELKAMYEMTFESD